jgi:hypothetical protein
MSQVMSAWGPLDIGVKRNHQRAYVLLGNDLLRIFEFIEPVPANGCCYGHQIYQLYLRVCTELEAVCKLACRRLDFPVRHSKKGVPLDWNMHHDYSKLNEQLGCCLHDSCSTSSSKPKLSDYKFYFHDWGVSETPICPLESFANGQDPSPLFYKSYNDVKHDREKAFKQANLANLMNSFAALIAVLDWQGISVDSHIVADCSGETVIGARFGYFLNCESQELTARVNF